MRVGQRSLLITAWVPVFTRGFLKAVSRFFLELPRGQGCGSVAWRLPWHLYTLGSIPRPERKKMKLLFETCATVSPP